MTHSCRVVCSHWIFIRLVRDNGEYDDRFENEKKAAEAVATYRLVYPDETDWGESKTIDDWKEVIQAHESDYEPRPDVADFIMRNNAELKLLSYLVYKIDETWSDESSNSIDNLYQEGMKSAKKRNECVAKLERAIDAYKLFTKNYHDCRYSYDLQHEAIYSTLFTTEDFPDLREMEKLFKKSFYVKLCMKNSPTPSMTIKNKETLRAIHSMELEKALMDCYNTVS